MGLLGGSFNPAHAGHVHISQLAISRLCVDRIWWLVSPQNPLKERAGMAPLEARLLRARSVAGTGRIDVSNLETELGTIYTVDTIRSLTRVCPHIKFVWIMGADNLSQVSRWRHWPLLFRSLPIAIFDRAAYARGALVSQAAREFSRSRLAARAASSLVYSRAPAWVFIQSLLHPDSGTCLRSRGLWDCW